MLPWYSSHTEHLRTVRSQTLARMTKKSIEESALLIEYYERADRERRG